MRQQKAQDKKAAYSLRWMIYAGFAAGALLLLNGCAAAATTAPKQAPTKLPDLPAASPTAATFTPAAVIPASTPALDLATPTTQVTTTPQSVFTICSPLEGIQIEELSQPDLLKNPFQMPRPGMDDGHHGADFAYWSRGDRTTMQGLPIYSVLSGKVAGVIQDRPPYGNAVIVETPLDTLPEEYIDLLAVPIPQPTVPAAPSLYCPADAHLYGGSAGRSLYLLYAHMDKPSTLSVGDLVQCGDLLGEVGTTGKSVNNHLHLEARAGPSGSVFTSLAHYDTAATEEEMSVYCTWRVSGLFQMFDPLKLFPELAPEPSLQP